MPLYIDSSFLLNIIYSEDNSAHYLSFFNGTEFKFSSVLLEIEARRSIHFIFSRHEKKLPKKWLHDSSGFLNDLLSQINLKNVDSDITSELKKNAGILELKSLDAVHLATAHSIKHVVSENMFFCSLDAKLRTKAKKSGFIIFPDI